MNRLMLDEGADRTSGSDEHLPLERLEADIAGLAATIASTTCRWLELVAEYDRRRGWESWECRSMAHWLVWHVGMGRSTAREHVRVANALTALPELRREFGAGRLSYSRIRTVTRVATPDNEHELITIALAATAPQLDRLVVAIERVAMAQQDDIAELIFQTRSLTFSRDPNGAWIARLRLPPEIGALLENLINEQLDIDTEDPATCDNDDPLGVNQRYTIEQRRADAFAAIVERVARTDPRDVDDHVDDHVGEPCDAAHHGGSLDGERTDLTDDRPIDVPIEETTATTIAERPPPRTRAHGSLDDTAIAPINAERPRPARHGSHQLAPPDLSSGHPAAARGYGRTQDATPLVVVHRHPHGADLNGRPLPVTTADRLACDCATVTLEHDLAGNPLNYGRQRRTPTTAQRRAVTERDRCCRVPGCHTRRGLHVHHVKWYQRDNGTTDLENLILVCATHHRAIHDRGWTIQIDADERLHFIPPDRHGPISRPQTVDLDRLVATFLDPLGPIRPTAGTGEHLDLELAVWGHFANQQVRAQRQQEAQRLDSAPTEAPHAETPPQH